MVPTNALERWRRDGFVVLPGYLPAADVLGALAGAAPILPSATTFHGGAGAGPGDGPGDGTLDRFRSEFDGVTNFPFDSVELSLLAVDERLIDLAAGLLGSGADNLRVYAIEAWAKFSGAADYDQSLHRDYLNHSLLVPDPAQDACQVEMFLYLDDVPDDLGPPAVVPLPLTSHLPALPNWYPRDVGHVDPEQPTWSSPNVHPDLYAHEQSASGPAGTVLAYRLETFHRGTALHRPLGARYTIHVNFRRADAEWLTRRSWTDAANDAPWQAFVVRASPRQLRLFGFPAPGHPYWTDATLRGMVLRYPGFDPSPWRW